MNPQPRHGILIMPSTQFMEQQQQTLIIYGLYQLHTFPRVYKQWFTVNSLFLIYNVCCCSACFLNNNN